MAATVWYGSVVYGQSLSTGTFSKIAGATISVTQPYSNLTFVGGVRAGINSTPDYATTKPLIEEPGTLTYNGVDGDGADEGETICSGAANYLNELALARHGIATVDLVTFASCPGHGGTTIAQLQPGIGSWYNQIFIQHVTKMHDRAVSASKTLIIHDMPWMQGEADISTATRSYYKGALESLRDSADTTVKSITGQTAPLVMLTYQTAFNITAFPNVALAQLDACREYPHIHLVSPIYDLDHHTDHLHLAAFGEFKHSKRTGRARFQWIVEGRIPDSIDIISAVMDGTTLKATFRVPTPPLVIDDVNMYATTGHGFVVKDNVGTIVMSEPIVGSDGISVAWELGRLPGEGGVLRYAMDHIAAGWTNYSLGSATGNLRDSTTDTFVYSAVTYPLWHIAPHLEEPIQLYDPASATLVGDGIIECFETDNITVIMPGDTNIAMPEDLSLYGWTIRFSDSPDFTNLIGPTLSKSDRSIIATSLASLASVIAFSIKPLSVGLAIPVDTSGRYMAYKDFYFTVMKETAVGTVYQTRKHATLRVYRAITKQ